MKKDYCGSQGLKIISFLVPDKPFGVNLVPACKKHDEAWSEEANKKADLELFEDILDAFYIHAERKSWNKNIKNLFFYCLGYPTASLYFLGVRFGGIFYKINYKIESKK
jgi:hypothetical protein